MSTRTSLCGAGLLIVLVASAGHQTPVYAKEQSDDYVLTLRILPNASDHTLARIAEYGEPGRYEPSREETYKQIARMRYGVFNDQIAKLMRKFNPQLRSFDAKPQVTVVLPPGPVWSFKVHKELLKNSNVSQELVLLTGSAGTHNVPDFLAANPKVADMLERLPEGIKLMFPWVSQVVSFRLKREYVSRRAEIEQGLNRLRGVADARISPQPRAVPGFSEGVIASFPMVARPTKETTPFWPFTTWFWPGRQPTLLRKNTALIAVLDTGIPQVNENSPLPEAVLWRNSAEFPGNRKDDDASSCPDDIYGCNLLSSGTRGFPIDDDTEGTVHYHGTHVAGLLIGALLPENPRKQVQDSVQLMTLKVLDSAGNADIGATASALVYARRKKANIVNMSLQLYRLDPAVEDALDAGKNSDMLFVVAAGDKPEERVQGNLDQEDLEVYPAKYSKRMGLRDNLLTVAAHDAAGKLAPISNWGENTVDLAAPGVDVESLTPLNTQKTQKLSGTSQAAPIVSLTAALLWVEGITSAPGIKRRLVASVDYEPLLKGKVRSEGRLDIAKALAIDDDVVQLKSFDLVIGTLQNPAPLQLTALESPLDFGEVQKIIFNYSDNPGKADLILTFSQANGYRRFEQTLQIFPLRLKVEGTVREIQRSEALDLVPRYFRK